MTKCASGGFFHVLLAVSTRSDWLASEYSERASQSERVNQSKTFFMLRLSTFLTASIVIYLLFTLSFVVFDSSTN